MSACAQGAFGFLERLPWRPERPERVFIGLFPDDPLRTEAERLSLRTSSELNLVGRKLEAKRYHTTLVHLSDRKRLRSKDGYAAALAAKTISMPPFEIVYTRLGSFPGAPRKDRPQEHPLVLLAADGPVMELHARLSTELRKYGFRMPGTFRPHLTLSYNRQFVPTQPIEPISFVARDYALIHSQLWLHKYHILGSWPLH